MPAKFGKRKQPVRRRPRKGKFVRKKPFQKKGFARAQYNKELKSVESTTVSHTLSHQTKTSSRMANGIVLYPVGFNSGSHSFANGSSDGQIIGSWASMTYLTHKFIVDWSSLSSHADLGKGLELRCRYGYITVTPNKANCSLASANAWQTAVDSMVIRELQDSNIDENHLSFAHKSRTVKILGDFMVRPNLYHRVSDNDNVSGTTADFAPPKNLTINWDKKKLFMKRKTKLAKTDDAEMLVLHHVFVPFVYFSSNNITANMGDITISDSSKLWYHDN